MIGVRTRLIRGHSATLYAIMVHLVMNEYIKCISSRQRHKYTYTYTPKHTRTHAQRERERHTHTHSHTHTHTHIYIYIYILVLLLCVAIVLSLKTMEVLEVNTVPLFPSSSFPPFYSSVSLFLSVLFLYPLSLSLSLSLSVPLSLSCAHSRYFSISPTAPVYILGRVDIFFW